MHVNEIVPNLEDLLDRRLITKRKHPQFDLWIVNYTNSAQIGWMFNNEPSLFWCRGLIIDMHGEVITLPMKKFGNPGDFKIDTSGPCVVMDKLDGSLIQVVYWRGKLIVSSRGSFESEQAQWALEHIRSNADLFDDIVRHCRFAGGTMLFEGIYAANRIVVKYDFDDLVFLGYTMPRIDDGIPMYFTPDEFSSWKRRKAQTFECTTYAEALALEPRENAEGVVCYFPNTGDRVKLKQSDYLAMHRIVSDFSAKAIWRQIIESDFETAKEYVAALPDEFHAEGKQILADLRAKYDEIIAQSLEDYYDIMRALNVPEGQWSNYGDVISDADRKRFSARAQGKQNVGFMFMILDGKRDQVISKVWKQLEPKGN